MQDSKEHTMPASRSSSPRVSTHCMRLQVSGLPRKLQLTQTLDGTTHSIKKRQRNISFNSEYPSSMVSVSYTTTDAGRWSVYPPFVLQAQNFISSPLGTDTTVGLVRCHIMHLPLAERESTPKAENSKRYSQTSLCAQHSLYEGSLSSCKEMFQPQASSQATVQESAGCACLPSLTDFL